MYSVENLEKNKNKTYKVTIKSSKKSVTYDVSIDLIVEYRLVKDKELTKDEYTLFLVAKDRDILYQKVLHYALYKMRATKDITDYLNKKSIPVQEHDYYINKLKKSKILDDALYAEIFVRENFDYKKDGPNKIIHTLESKHIPKHIYQPLIDNLSISNIKDNLNYLLNKKLKSIKNKTVTVAMHNVTKYLVDKGYNYDISKSFIEENKILFENQIKESDILKKDYEQAKKKYLNKEKSRELMMAYLLRKGHAYQAIKTITKE